jgi:hypothetical protein
MHIVTTLNAIRAESPCHDGWTKLLKHLGKTTADDAPLDLLTVLDSNGFDDALWVLDNVIRNLRIISLFSADCAEQVLPLFLAVRPDDTRPANAIRVARDANASDEDRDAAWDAARAAAWAAAGDAARAAAWAAAGDAARAAAWAAAGDAAWAAARDAAGAAAGDAARAAAWAAAWDAARAAAGAAAWAAARAAQERRMRQYLTHGEAAADMPWPELVEA